MSSYYDIAQPYMRLYGGIRTRFGSTLSGNANPRVMWGSPTGGTEGPRLNPKFYDSYKIGGKRKCKCRGRGSMDSYINPPTYGRTYPYVGSTIY